MKPVITWQRRREPPATASPGIVPAGDLSWRPQNPRGNPRASRPGAQGRAVFAARARAPEAARQNRSAGQATGHIQRRADRKTGPELAANRDGMSAYLDFLAAAFSQPFRSPVSGIPGTSPSASRAAATATMGHRCCPAGPGNRNSGPWMSLPQQRWPNVAVARPSRSSNDGPTLRLPAQPEQHRWDIVAPSWA